MQNGMPRWTPLKPVKPQRLRVWWPVFRQPLPYNQRKNKHVESRLVRRLDSGSSPLTSTKNGRIARPFFVEVNLPDPPVASRQPPGARVRGLPRRASRAPSCLPSASKLFFPSCSSPFPTSLKLDRWVGFSAFFLPDVPLPGPLGMPGWRGGHHMAVLVSW